MKKYIQILSGLLDTGKIMLAWTLELICIVLALIAITLSAVLLIQYQVTTALWYMVSAILLIGLSIATSYHANQRPKK